MVGLDGGRVLQKGREQRGLREDETKRTAFPFFVTVPATKDVPLPVASTDTETEVEPSPPLCKQSHSASQHPTVTEKRREEQKRTH